MDLWSSPEVNARPPYGTMTSMARPVRKTNGVAGSVAALIAENNRLQAELDQTHADLDAIAAALPRIVVKKARKKVVDPLAVEKRRTILAAARAARAEKRAAVQDVDGEREADESNGNGVPTVAVVKPKRVRKPKAVVAVATDDGNVSVADEA